MAVDMPDFSARASRRIGSPAQRLYRKALIRAADQATTNRHVSEVSRLIEMAYCRLSPDLMMEKLRATRQENWQRNRAGYQRRRRDEMAV